MDDEPNTFLIDNNLAKLLPYSKRLIPEDPEAAALPKAHIPTTLPYTAKAIHNPCILVGMATFTKLQQQKHRQDFIDECRQNAWGAACHANWIGDQLDRLIDDYAKLKKDDEALEAEIKTYENAVDAHTKDNRDKRKGLQERRSMPPRKKKPPA
jgi:hypothetical protein